MTSVTTRSSAVFIPMTACERSEEPFFKFDAEEELQTSPSPCASWEWGALKGDNRRESQSETFSPCACTPVRKPARATAGAVDDGGSISKPSNFASYPRARAATGNLDWLNMETDDWNLPPPCLQATFSALRQHARDARFGTECFFVPALEFCNDCRYTPAVTDSLSTRIGLRLTFPSP